MTRIPLIARIAGAVALTLMLLATASGSASAADTSTLTLHKRVCPAGQVITDLFEDCHDILPEQTVAFTLNDGVPQAVGVDGNTTFTDLAAGTYTVAEVEGPPLGYVHLRVFCSVQGTVINPAEELAVDVNTFDVTLGAGEEVVCDVYNIAEDLSGRTPTPVQTAQPTAAATTVTLPSTGAGTGSAGMTSVVLLFGSLAGSLLLLTLATIRFIAKRGTQAR